MTDIQKIEVNLPQQPYYIYMGNNVLPDFESFLPKNLKDTSRFFIADSHTEVFARKMAPDNSIFVVPSGESSKSFNVYEDVMNFLLDHKISRKSLIFAVGGGVVGDLSGFAAATALRGVPVIQVPTSLLAMVDSSVGGKTGINSAQGKNLVGAFHQPSAVICDFDVLKTLPERELKAGYAEILKYALLGDADFYDWLEENGHKVLALEPDALSYAVKRSCEMKAEIVIADEKETSGQRALLNLGHTFAHAFEALMGYDGRLLHGEAVAIGMVCAMELSVRKGFLSAQKVERVEQHLSKLKLKKSIKDIELEENVKPENLLNIMRGDKKAQDGLITFIMMKEIGQAFLCSDIKDKEVIDLFNDML